MCCTSDPLQIKSTIIIPIDRHAWHACNAFVRYLKSPVLKGLIHTCIVTYIHKCNKHKCIHTYNIYHQSLMLPINTLILPATLAPLGTLKFGSQGHHFNGYICIVIVNINFTTVIVAIMNSHSYFLNNMSYKLNGFRLPYNKIFMSVISYVSMFLLQALTRCYVNLLSVLTDIYVTEVSCSSNLSHSGTDAIQKAHTAEDLHWHLVKAQIHYYYHECRNEH